MDFHKVDEIFAAWDKPGSPGAALAVLKDGDVIYRKGYGYANLEYDIPITSSTVFHVASVSKQFTAACIGLLALENKLELDGDIRTYLPEVADLGATVTVRHLVHHTSGIRDQWELVRLGGWRMDDVITHDHVMRMMRRQRELNFRPGDEYLYSNMGYSLMAEIVARVSGMSFRDFAWTRIFEPLGMVNTHVHDDHEEIVRGRSYSYAPKKSGGWRHSVLSYANMGATSLFTTAEDLALWLKNFDHNLVGGPSLKQLMEKTFVLNDGKDSAYGFGLRVDTFRGLRHIGHSGSDAGYRTFLTRFPEERFGVVVLTNLSTMVPSDLGMKVAEVFLGEKMGPQTTISIPVTAWTGEPCLSAFEGRYVLNMGGGLVHVTSGADGLKIDVEGLDNTVPVTRSGSHSFVSPFFKEPVSFKADETGNITGFTATIRGGAYTARRLLPIDSEPGELVPYTGKYYSPELDTTYVLALAGGKLVVRHQRLPESDLLLTGEDTFVTRPRGDEVRFQRSYGRITGFTITANRVRDIRFILVE